MTDAVIVDGLEKHFGEVKALRGVSFRAPAGSCLAILGPNGAGKTTAVNILTTLIKPTAGTATVAGHDVVKDPAAVRSSIMLTGQYAALDETLTGRENAILFGRLMGLSRRKAKKRADELLAEFDLTDAGSRPVSGYSGGMRRRIDIACGLVVRPEVVFLDEPTTGLDPRSRQAVWDLVERLQAQGITVILTTQYLEEADLLADNIVVIDKGSVVAQGTADELKSRTGMSYLEIVPERPDQMMELADALGDVLPLGSRPQPGDVKISFPAPGGSKTLAQAVRMIDAAGIEVSDIALRRPTLDEVFLSVTGQPPPPSLAEVDAAAEQLAEAEAPPTAPLRRRRRRGRHGGAPAVPGLNTETASNEFDAPVPTRPNWVTPSAEAAPADTPAPAVDDAPVTEIIPHDETPLAEPDGAAADPPAPDSTAPDSTAPDSTATDFPASDFPAAPRTAPDPAASDGGGRRRAEDRDPDEIPQWTQFLQEGQRRSGGRHRR